MDKNNPNDDSYFNDQIKWKNLGFFSAEDYLVYIFKTEKITAALHLVSGLLKDDEPMKWELRDLGMELLSSSFAASSSVPGDKNMVIQSLFASALETISLLNVARVSNLISPMNHDLLVKEIDRIVGLLGERLAQSAENAGYVLSESFFRTPDLFSSGFKSDSKANLQRSNGTPSMKKTFRHDLIINALKGQSNLTVKDFSKVIKDCSQKTIQRDLLELVSKGVVKKEGQRRWSRYSLS